MPKVQSITEELPFLHKISCMHTKDFYKHYSTICSMVQCCIACLYSVCMFVCVYV